MYALSNIDMGEVTRLTQAGKLAEAMALLQGTVSPARGHSAQDRPHTAESTKHSWPTIDMVAPAVSGGAWTAPGEPRNAAAAEFLQSGEAAGLQGIAQRMRALRDRLPKLGSIPGAGEGLGSMRQPPVPVPDGARFEERIFSNNVGSRTYKVYVPSGYTGQALPLVVMLHGCTQNPDDFAAGTRMNELAEEQTFLVAYPRQPQAANMQKCWNWFNAADQQREGGEPSLIAGIALQVVEEFSTDPTRVYVAGLSAGGAAAAIMAATYPDLFAAVGVHSGLACGAARDMPSAFAAMGGGGTTRPRRAGPRVPTIVFHGDADRTVNPVNSDHVVAQARPNAALTEVVSHGKTPGGMAYTRTVQLDTAGREILEQWVLHGVGHAWSGGSASGSYTDARGPDASREMIRFFLAHASTKDATRH
ncbi:MAG: PHB depolymerase family esterase [Beijerinckiaceae bacterium]